jgi:hypothetical protein
MARIRTVKPELFLDEELGTLSGDHLSLFVGLWTQADRDGRLEDRPTRLKAALFPYRDIDVERLLKDLEGIAKIRRYEAGGLRCIAIPGFQKHQRPHPKEPASTIPEPGKETASREKTRPAVERFSAIPSSPVGREGKGREGDLGRGPVPPDTAPTGSLRDGIEAEFKKLRGTAYRWSSQDEFELRQALDLGVPEILRRWGIALRREGYPRCDSVRDLVKHLNAYAADPPRKSNPGDPRRAPIRAEDQNHGEVDLDAKI